MTPPSSDQTRTQMRRSAGVCRTAFTSRFSTIRSTLAGSTGTTTEDFTVEVDDCGEPGSADTFSIRTTTYSNGPNTLIGGNIQIH